MLSEDVTPCVQSMGNMVCLLPRTAFRLGLRLRRVVDLLQQVMERYLKGPRDALNSRERHVVADAASYRTERAFTYTGHVGQLGVRETPSRSQPVHFHGLAELHTNHGQPPEAS